MAKPKKKGGDKGKSKPAKKVSAKKSPAKKEKEIRAPKPRATGKGSKPLTLTPVPETPKQPIPVATIETPKPAVEETKPTPVAPAKPADEISAQVKNSAYALDTLITQSKPMTKSGVEAFLSNNAQIQVVPVFSATGYYLEVYDMGKKMRIPFTGEYPLAV